ncbi:MAG TPA: efflux RND transporter periplasmic adaptor subunit [Rudaea sp.]|nr:efflux RND transporter periplasmic adaptor subunit [Rudaea sp.]
MRTNGSRWYFASALPAAAVVAAAIAMRFTAGGNAKAVTREAPPLAVETSLAQVQAMPVQLQAVGVVVSMHTVEIRPQVAGKLERVWFTEGEPVAAGQRLFRIEAAPFEAALTSAQATWQNAKSNADRLELLAQRGYVVPQDYRNARAAAEQARGAFQQAKINLGYTVLRAPIAGRTGSIASKAGNIVAPADAVPLVTINRMQPIEVQFSLPQQYLPDVRHYQRENGIRVVLKTEDGRRELDRGELAFVDNTINAGAGTVMLKAQCPNADDQLWPGQYVRVDLELTVEPHAVVVDRSAVNEGQNGSFVYVVAEGRALVREVSIDRQVDELAVISAGLVGGERVVSRVPRNLRPGMRIAIATPGRTLPAAVNLPGIR